MFVFIERAFKRMFRRNSSADPSTDKSFTYDDIFFRFYYRYTGTILFIISILIVLREWSVDAVDCNIPATVVTEITTVGADVSSYRMNSYCKMHNRFMTVDGISSRNDHCNQTQPTVTPSLQNNRRIKTIPKYQLFSLIMFASAIIVIIPHILWKCSNKSMIKSVVNRIRNQMPDNGYRSCELNIHWDRLLRNTLSVSEDSGHQLMFCFLYLSLKAVNFFILFGLILITDHLLHNQFLTYPLLFIEKFQLSHIPLLDQKNLESANKASTNCTKNIPSTMKYYEDIFPKYALCPYTYLDPKTLDSRLILVNCLMPINSLLEQIFFFLWVWYALILLLTILDFFRYSLLFFSRGLREIILKYNTNNILSDQLYLQASTSFSSWLFMTIVIIDNHNYYECPVMQQIPEMERNPLYIPMSAMAPGSKRHHHRSRGRRARLEIIPEEAEEETTIL